MWRKTFSSPDGYSSKLTTLISGWQYTFTEFILVEYFEIRSRNVEVRTANSVQLLTTVSLGLLYMDSEVPRDAWRKGGVGNSQAIKGQYAMSWTCLSCFNLQVGTTEFC